LNAVREAVHSAFLPQGNFSLHCPGLKGSGLTKLRDCKVQDQDIRPRGSGRRGEAGWRQRALGGDNGRIKCDARSLPIEVTWSSHRVSATSSARESWKLPAESGDRGKYPGGEMQEDFKRVYPMGSRSSAGSWTPVARHSEPPRTRVTDHLGNIGEAREPVGERRRGGSFQPSLRPAQIGVSSVSGAESYTRLKASAGRWSGVKSPHQLWGTPVAAVPAEGMLFST